MGESAHEEAEAFAAEWPSYDLDFSPASLARLDALILTEFPVEEFAGVALGDATDESSPALTMAAIDTGAYVAEVLSRTLDAEWKMADGSQLIVSTDDGEVRLDPVATAADCCRREDSFAAIYDRLNSRF